MMRWVLCAVCLWFSAASASAVVYYETSFDVDDSADWIMTDGSWTFDTTAGTVSRSSVSVTTSMQYLGAIDPETLADYSVTAEITRTGAGGYEGSDAAVIGRAQWLSGDTYQYYMLRYNDHDHTRTAPVRQLQLYRLDHDGDSLLDTLAMNAGELSGFDPDQPYTLSLTMIGADITGMLSQQAMSWSMDFTDTGTTVLSGTGGLRIWQGTITCHDFAMTHGAPDDTTPPAAPTVLTAVPGDGVVGLNWADNTEPDLNLYNVYRSLTGGIGHQLIGTSGSTDSSFLDDMVVNGTVYYYVVTAIDLAGYESAVSNEASAVPSAPDPNATTVLVETESFDNKGGWVADQQFMDQMGSPFLLAHGITSPVADAITTITLPKTGIYRIWVRTRDWTAWWKEPYYTMSSLKYSAGEGPGRFEVLVNGEALTPAEPFGSQSAQWYWQDGGTVVIDTPMVSLRLHDLTGYEGRCDAIVLTTGIAFTPPNEDPAMRLWRQSLREDPAVTQVGHYDLVVVGGGMAGCCAAISGARQGLSVALIQDRPVLGGNNSSEVRVGARGATNFSPYPKIGDIVSELDSGVDNRGSTPSYLAADQRKFDVVLNEPNIDLYLNYRGNEVETDSSSIVAVIAEGTTTDPDIRSTGLSSVAGERLRFTAGCFADCTGDGVIGYLAGADWDMTVSDGQVHRMGRSNLWRFVSGGQNIVMGPYLWALDLYNEVSGKARFPTNSLGDWFWESGFFHDPFDENEYLRDWNFRAAYGAWDALKNHMGRTDYYAQWQAYISGKRETRRLLGDIILDDDDFFDSVSYPDGCVPTSWGRDLHYPNTTWYSGFEGDAFISSYTSPGYSVPYWIPYRCLYSRNIDNLFMAGRDISVTHEGLGPVRVMRTCGMMGEIVGMAASLCKKHDVNPRAVYTDHLGELQALMIDAEPKTHTNVSLGKPVIVDSLYNDSYVAANAVDGDNRSTASRWLSADSAYPHWIEVDLQGEYSISQLKFWTGYTSYETPPSDFRFQKWDGQGWFDILSETGNTDSSYSRDFPPVSTARVRLYMTSGPINIVKLFEIEVGAKLETVPAVPTGLVATAADGQVRLNWSDNSEGNLTGYKVYRSMVSGDYGTALAATTASEFVDGSVVGGIRYYYVVTATNDSGQQSELSDEVFGPTYRGDLTFDDAVDMWDIAELSSGWNGQYGTSELVDLAGDWLKGTEPSGPP